MEEKTESEAKVEKPQEKPDPEMIRKIRLSDSTGKVLMFLKLQQSLHLGDFSQLGAKPRENCKKCLGTGSMGFNHSTGFYEPCSMCMNIGYTVRILK
jgi:DnaJ-class molecular chaperone